MLTEVELYNERGETLTLPLQSHTDGYLIEDITGLDPVKASLSSSNFATMDGAQYQSARRETRNIVLTVGLVSDFVTNTVRGLRQALYGYASPKSAIRLRFISQGEPTVEIWGRVESLESALFTAEPTVEISIICYDPDFQGISTDSVSGITRPFTDATMTEYVYDGSSDTGFKMSITANRSITGFALYFVNSEGESTTFDVKLSMTAGQTLDISMVPGSKSLILNGTTSVLYAISPNTGWPMMTPGVNRFRVVLSGAAISYTFTLIKRYGGL